MGETVRFGTGTKDYYCSKNIELLLYHAAEEEEKSLYSKTDAYQKLEVLYGRAVEEIVLI